MTSCHSWRAFGVLVFVVVGVLSLTQHATAAEACANVSDPVVLHYDATSGACTQNGKATPVFADRGRCVTYSSDNVSDSSFEVQFAPGSTPFYDFKAASGQTLTIGPIPSQVTPGQTYNYSSLKVSGSYCLNASQLGLVMR
jgi:hypothetical protein